MKVSAAFRKKVDKVIEKESIHGNYSEITYGNIQLPQFPFYADNLQAVGGVVNDDYSKWSFDPENWAHLLECYG